MTRNLATFFLVALLSLNVVHVAPAAILFFEDFEGLELGPSVDEGNSADDVWTKEAPPGWTIDDSGVSSIGNPDSGMTEWEGWSFTDREWWSTMVDDQRRSEFLLGVGTVAVADPDEWDDRGDPDSQGTYTSFLTTPPISLEGVLPGTAAINFASSWRQEEPQEVNLTISYDGGADIEILRWSHTGPNFHDDAPNEIVNLSLNNPEGASSVEITFGMLEARNDWWWAVDNIEVSGTKPVALNGSGETYTQDFDSMGVATGRNVVPEGWTTVDVDGSDAVVDTLGLVDGPLNGVIESAIGIVNAGGSAGQFSAPADRVGTWNQDLDNSGAFDQADVVQDNDSDRALGVGRESADDPGSLGFQIDVGGSQLRAFTFDWDLEVWGGDPEAVFRGTEGAGFTAEVTVNGNSYYTETVALLPGDLFDTSFDLSPTASGDGTLINGNLHAVRGNSSGIVEVSAADGAVGNPINLSFNADHGGADEGWITAVDNVQLRALAAGDAQADGDVDPADLIQLLAGAAFGKGNIDATWGQGDFDNDGDFDGFDILQIVQGLAGEFPKTYAHDPSNGVPDVLINLATGNITLDTNGTTIGSIVMDSAAGIFNGPNSPSWDAPGDFAADIDTQISMPISFTNPGYTGVDDLGDGIIGDLAPGFDILADLTIKYLDPNGDLLDAEAHVVPEPSSMVLATFGVLAMLGYLWRRRRLG